MSDPNWARTELVMDTFSLSAGINTRSLAVLVGYNGVDAIEVVTLVISYLPHLRQKTPDLVSNPLYNRSDGKKRWRRGYRDTIANPESV